MLALLQLLAVEDAAQQLLGDERAAFRQLLDPLERRMRDDAPLRDDGGEEVLDIGRAERLQLDGLPIGDDGAWGRFCE